MAIKTFVTGSSTLTVFDNDTEVVGAAGGNEKIKIMPGVTGVKTNAEIEKIDVAGNLADYKFVFVPGVGTQVQNLAGVVVATIESLNQPMTLAFADGSAPLVQTGSSTFTLGNQTVPTTAAPITTAALGTTFDTTVKTTVVSTPVSTVPTFAVTGAATAAEATTASFTVALTNRAAGVSYGVTTALAATGGATAGTDFTNALTLDAASVTAGITLVNNVLTIPASSSVASVTLTTAVTADSLSPEAGEGLSLTLSAPTGASAVVSSTAASATTTITDVPVTYTLTASAADVYEGAPITYTLTASAPVSTATTVAFSVVAGDVAAANQGTANTNLNDFASGAFNPSSVVIAAGQKTASYTVTGTADTVTELPEAYTVKATIGGVEVATKTASLLDGNTTGGGQTFTLTTGVDNIVGLVGSAGTTSNGGNDAINGVSDGVTSTTVGAGQPVTQTFGGLDSLDGGLGVDTMTLTNDVGTMTLATSVTVKDVENLTLRSAQNAITADVQNWTGLNAVTIDQKGTAAAITVTTKSNATSVNVSKGTAVGITDNGTTDTLATVLLNGNTGAATITSDALTALTVAETNQNATVTAAAATRALGITVNKLTGGNLRDDTATTVNVTASTNASTGVTLTTDAATTVTFAGDKTLSLTLADTGGVAATVTTITSTNTAGITIAPALGNAVLFTGGAGDDSISLGATTKAITMGAGNDTVALTAAVTGSIDAGDGIGDILSLTAADATTLSASTTFENGFSNFEKVSVGVVGATTTSTVQLANIDDINYVVSAGTTAGVTGSTETASVVYSGLLSGQSITVGGLTLTATNGDLTAAQVAEAMDGDTDGLSTSGVPVAAAVVTGTLTGFTATPIAAGTTVVYTSTTAATNVVDLAQSSANSTAATAPAVTVTAGVTAVTESSVVSFGSLNAGEVATVAGRTVTAATAATESASIVFTALAAGEALTINGLTVTSAAGTATDAELATAFKIGANNGVADLTVTGLWAGGYSNDGGATTVVFTSTTPNTNVTDLASSGTGAAKGVVTVTQGFNGVVTAAEVATAMGSAGATIAGKLTVGGALTGFTASTSTNNAVTFTSSTAGTPVTDISATSTGNQPTVVTTQGVTGVTESASIVFSALKSGQSISVDGLILTATGGDLTAAQVAEALDGDADGLSTSGTPVAAAVVSGALTGYTAGAIASGSTVVYTSTTASTDVTNINNATNLTGAGAANTIGVGPATAPTAPAVTATDGGVGATAGGILAITGMGANGTVELTNILNGASSVTLANSSGSADVLNVKLNGTANLVNAAALTASGVETINITATDSSSDTTTLTNPAAASTILLAVADATKITVAGNHGVNFTGSTLTKVVELDASGVVSVGNAAGATATQIGTTGAVTFTSVVTDKAVTVKTGNGADVVDVSSISNATFLATNVTASTITTGDGNDFVTGSAGKDVIDTGAGVDSIVSGLGADSITAGAGNDIIVYTAAAQSTLAAKDVITGFSANTFGNGTSGAAGTGAAIASQTSFTGDVIDLRSFIAGAITKVSVAVVGSEASATISLQNVGDATTDTIAAAIDSTTGNLYLDVNSDGVADSVIQLSGVTTLTNAAFLVA